MSVENLYLVSTKWEVDEGSTKESMSNQRRMKKRKQSKLKIFPISLEILKLTLTQGWVASLS